VSPNQMIAVHKMIFKYWKQILNASDSNKLTPMVIKYEITEMNKIKDDQLPLYITEKWVYSETKTAFLNRLKSEQLVLDL